MTSPGDGRPVWHVNAPAGGWPPPWPHPKALNRKVFAVPGGTSALRKTVNGEAPVISSSLKKRAPGYIKMGFPDPRKIDR